jgi:hypothetical protein
VLELCDRPDPSAAAHEAAAERERVGRAVLTVGDA